MIRGSGLPSAKESQFSPSVQFNKHLLGIYREPGLCGAQGYRTESSLLGDPQLLLPATHCPSNGLLSDCPAHSISLNPLEGLCPRLARKGDELCVGWPGALTPLRRTGGPAGVSPQLREVWLEVGSAGADAWAPVFWGPPCRGSSLLQGRCFPMVMTAGGALGTKEPGSVPRTSLHREHDFSMLPVGGQAPQLPWAGRAELRVPSGCGSAPGQAASGGPGGEEGPGV